jgi:hypothetical protein
MVANYVFEVDRLFGTIKGSMKIANKLGSYQQYQCSLAIRGGRGIMIASAVDSSEPCFIDVVPFLGNQALDVHCGVRILQTWDGSSGIGPCLYTRRKLANPTLTVNRQDMTVQDSQTLDSIWVEQMSKQAIVALFPG